MAERAWVVQAKRDGDTSLEASKNPDLDPTPFLVKVPRKDAACLHDGKDVLACRHGTVNVLPRFGDMEFGEAVPPRAIGLECNIT